MLKLIPLLLTLWCSLSFAQFGPDLSFLQTQDTLGAPTIVSVPLPIDPVLHAAYKRSQVRYVLPNPSDAFAFSENIGSNQWIEYSRHRHEWGAGLGALIGAATPKLGISGYKGAYNTFVQVKDQHDELLEPMFLPFELTSLESWRVGDYGSFQTYGGLHLQLRAGVSVVLLAHASLTLQNQFILSIKKINEDEILFTIAEEELTQRKLRLGPLPLYGSVAELEGQRLSASFRLNCSDPFHQQLFQEALAGDLTGLQENLPETAQELQWSGIEKTGYVGIPWIVGRSIAQGHYELEIDEVESELHIRERQNRGLLPLRRHQFITLLSEEDMHLIWYNEMKKTKTSTLDKHYLSVGRAIGIAGFEQELPAVKSLGSTITQLAMSFSAQEVAGIKSIDRETLTQNFLERCQSLHLTCAKGRRHRSIMQKFSSIIETQQFKSKQLAKLLIKEPALIHSILQTLGLNKSGYFKFLSENFQSLEGWGELR